MSHQVAHLRLPPNSIIVLIGLLCSSIISRYLLAAEEYVLSRLDHFLLILRLLPIVDDLLKLSLGIAQVIQLLLLDFVLEFQGLIVLLQSLLVNQSAVGLLQLLILVYQLIQLLLFTT